MNLNNTAAIILAAGRGTRMNAKTKNKVAFKLRGKPMVKYTLDHLQQAKVSQIIVVVGFAQASVRTALGNSVEYAVQQVPRGTGDALKVALPKLNNDIQNVLLVSGDDSAFYPVELYQKMVEKRATSNSDLVVLTIHKDNPTGLGRIIRGRDGNVERIVEEKNATDKERSIQEINTGFYCFKRQFLNEYIDLIKENPVSGEYYVTDLVEIALAHGKKVDTYYRQDSSIWFGVNDRSDWAKAQKKAIHE